MVRTIFLIVVLVPVGLALGQDSSVTPDDSSERISPSVEGNFKGGSSRQKPQVPEVPEWLTGMWRPERTGIQLSGKPSNIRVLQSEMFGFLENRMFTVNASSQYAKSLLAIETLDDGRVFMMFARPNLEPYYLVAERMEDRIEIRSETRMRDGARLQITTTLNPISLDEAAKTSQKKIDWNLESAAWFPDADRTRYEEWLGLEPNFLPRSR